MLRHRARTKTTILTVIIQRLSPTNEHPLHASNGQHGHHLLPYTSRVTATTTIPNQPTSALALPTSSIFIPPWLKTRTSTKKTLPLQPPQHLHLVLKSTIMVTSSTATTTSKGLSINQAYNRRSTSGECPTPGLVYTPLCQTNHLPNDNPRTIVQLP